MSLGKKLFKAPPAEETGSGNTQDGLILHLDAADVDSFDNNGSTWYDIADFEYTPTENPEEHFNTVLYSGNASTNAITGVGFQPDLVWVKSRNTAVRHMLTDSVRGTSSQIFSNETSAESNYSEFTSFDSDGFTVTFNSGTQYFNNSGTNYVAWCFKAGGAPTASTPFMIDGTGYATASAAGMGDDGDLTLEKASVNTKLGFAIYKFDPDLVSGETNTFQHGLGAAPELIITKSVSNVYNWWTWTKQLDGSWDYVRLNGNHGKTNDTYTSGGIATADDINFSYTFAGVSSDHIMYAFSSVRGISKVGRYTGTGAAGNKVYTGFEPAWVLQKRINSSGTNWHIFDNKRNTSNPRTTILIPNTTAADGTIGGGIDFNADGFTLDTTNAAFNGSGNTYIYLAFAKNTKETSLIDDTPVFDLDLSTSTPSYVTVSNATYDEELGNFWQFIKSQNNNKLRLTKDQSLTNRTIEIWARADTLTGNYLMDATPDRGYGSDSYGNWCIYLNGTNVVFVSSKYNGSTYGGYYGSHGLSAGEWFHVAMICGGTTTRGFINGVEIAEISGSSYNKSQSVLGTNVDEMHLGFVRPGGSNTTYGWDGKIGQVRIYNSMLTPDQIIQNYRYTANNYPNGINFTNAGSRANWLSEGSWNFDASANEYFSHTAGAFQGKTGYNPFAISAWVKPDEVTSSWRVIIGTRGYSDGSNNGWQLYANQDDIKFWGNNGTGYELVTLNSVLSAGTWVHVFIQRTNDAWEGYINGSLSTNSSSNSTQHLTDDLGNLNSVDSDLIIGRNWQTNAYQWDGTISDIKIFNKALTAAEITAEYNKGKFGDK